jgi:hypothetical protein
MSIMARGDLEMENDLAPFRIISLSVLFCVYCDAQGLL